MMQPADHRKRDHVTTMGRLDGTWRGRILRSYEAADSQRQMGSRRGVVLEVLAEDVPQVLLTEDDDVIVDGHQET